jgi:hypothetical protein
MTFLMQGEEIGLNALKLRRFKTLPATTVSAAVLDEVFELTKEVSQRSQTGCPR